jgi:hypothetical protein
MKGIISIFVMPQELEDLALTLDRLKRNSVYLDDTVKYKVDITMCLSDELTDWENSKLPKEYIKERTIELVEQYLDWCLWDLQWDNPNILGCVSQRRFSLKNNPDADFFIWLDCDVFFKDITLGYVTSAYKMIKESGFEDIIVTPEFVKQWDNTWDMVANKNYWNYPINYHLDANIYKDSLPNIGDMQIKELIGYKFAGGWFTLISKSILDKTGIPESFGHYGLEDTYVMFCCGIMKNNNINVSQFILENLIVGEIHKNRTNKTIKRYLCNRDRKDEFKKIAEANFTNELNLFNSKFTNNEHTGS